MSNSEMNYSDTTYGLKPVPMPEQNKDGVREVRNSYLKTLHKFGMIYIVLSSILIGIGIAMMAVSAQGELGHPVFNVGPLLVGIMMLIAGLMALQIHSMGQQCRDSNETPKGVRALFMGFNGLCSACLGITGMAAAFSFMAVAACASETDKKAKYCTPGKEANIALAAIGGSLCIVFSVLCGIVSCWNWRHAYAFGVRGCCGRKCRKC